MHLRFLSLAFFILASMNVWSGGGGETISPLLEPNRTVIERLSSLSANQATILGKAEVIGNFNSVARRFELDRTGPYARDYSIKIVWAEDRERALFAGANHGEPHRLNDVWEFDLGALSWILLYAPDNPRSYAGLGDDPQDVEFKEGSLITTRGGPAVVGHTWWGLTYDLENRRMLFMSTWDTNQAAAIRELGGNPDGRYLGPPLWSFYPEGMKWKLIKTEPPFPRAPFGALLEYISDLNGVLWHANHWQMQATWLFQSATNRWEDQKSNSATGDFAAQSPKTEQVGYYDPRRREMIVQRGRETFTFDIDTRSWSRERPRSSADLEFPEGHDAFAPMYLDPHSGHGLLVDFRTNAMWAYNPDEKLWTRLVPKGAPMPNGSKRLGYFDVKHRVFVIIDGVNVWVYRYK